MTLFTAFPPKSQAGSKRFCSVPLWMASPATLYGDSQVPQERECFDFMRLQLRCEGRGMWSHANKLHWALSKMEAYVSVTDILISMQRLLKNRRNSVYIFTLDKVVTKADKRAVTILLGDFKAQLGTERRFKGPVGNYPAHKRTNKNRERHVKLSRRHKMRIMTTQYKVKTSKKTMRVSPRNRIGETDRSCSTSRQKPRGNQSQEKQQNGVRPLSHWIQVQMDTEQI